MDPLAMDLNQTIGGTRLTLFANLPKGQKVTTYALGSRRIYPISRSLNSGHRQHGVRHSGTAARLAHRGRSRPLFPARHGLPDPTKQRRRCLERCPRQSRWQRPRGRPPPRGYRASRRKARLRCTADPSRRRACARTASACSTPHACDASARVRLPPTHPSRLWWRRLLRRPWRRLYRTGAAASAMTWAPSSSGRH